ncbi:MAG: MMPL family transporter [Allobranchiibius sp.]
MTQTTSTEAPEQSKGRRMPRGVPFFAIIAVAIMAFLAGGFGGSYQGKLSEVQKNDNASYLPGSAESTKVSDESARFVTVENLPGFVVVHHDRGLTEEDKAGVGQAFAAIKALPGIDTKALTPPKLSADGTAAAIYVPLVAKDNGTSVAGDKLASTEKDVLAAAKQALPAGTEVYPAGPGGLLIAFIDAFGGLDGALLGAAFGVVILILLVVYRSPVLWFFPLFSAVLALGLSSVIIYYLAKNGVLTLTGQSQGILSVLVLGAGTDYALLLISRYREELHEYPNRFDAMIKAWRESAPAILASGLTVIIGLLCLSFSELRSNQSLGPVAAIGIACTLLVMMTFLPVALAAAGRWVFWPRRPRVDHAADLATHGLWGRIAATIGRRQRPAWIGALVLLLLCLSGIGSLQTNGLTVAQGFTGKPDAVVGQELYDAKFDKGTGAPAVITTNAAAAEQVLAAVRAVPGVDSASGSVCVQTDYAKLAAVAKQGGVAAPSPGCPPPTLQVTPIDGRTVVSATLADSYDSPQALRTVENLRTAVHGISGADALVGGSSAATLDVHSASVHDRNLIIPIVLVVIFLVLAVLLRALLAPLLLITTVVLSFAATLGVCGFAFTHVFGFAGADQSFPLFAFVFLVALGIDYNIFLMTRVREETLTHGTRAGVLRGLAVTGGVITSAGIVLAATFAVLGVLPLVFLAELGFAVAFGVLLDTIIVRSILVPALSHDIGKKIWWPSRLAHGDD